MILKTFCVDSKCSQDRPQALIIVSCYATHRTTPPVRLLLLCSCLFSQRVSHQFVFGNRSINFSIVLEIHSANRIITHFHWCDVLSYGLLLSGYTIQFPKEFPFHHSSKANGFPSMNYLVFLGANIILAISEMETLLVNLSMEVFDNKHRINSVMIDTCTMGFQFDSPPSCRNM